MEHAYGMFSLSTFTFHIGLLFNKNFKLAGLFRYYFELSLIVGIWVILLLILVTKYLQIIENKEFYYMKQIKNFLKVYTLD